MPRSAEAIVEPDLLRWARETAGVPLAEAARKVSVGADRLGTWEQGQARPTVVQLRNLARVYRRPLAAFYLPHPPKPLPALRDFRRPQTAAQPQSPQLRFAHRQAIYRRDVALALLGEIGEVAPPFPLSATMDDDPEEVGAALRVRLGMAADEHRNRQIRYDALNTWRSACEDAGVLVNQASGVDPSEMSGFSVGEFPLPVIVVNAKDLVQRRVFTMLHEVVHLAAHLGGLCEIDDNPGREPGGQRVEVFCNAVAGALLIPMADLRRHSVVLGHGPSAVWMDDELRPLATHYGVSWEVVLRRLLAAGLTTQQFYAERRDEFVRAYREMSRPVGGFVPHVPQYRRAIVRSGPRFAELVLRAYYEQRITAGDVSEYLGLQLKHLSQLEHELFAREPRRKRDPGAAGGTGA